MGQNEAAGVRTVGGVSHNAAYAHFRDVDEKAVEQNAGRLAPEDSSGLLAADPVIVSIQVRSVARIASTDWRRPSGSCGRAVGERATIRSSRGRPRSLVRSCASRAVAAAMAVIAAVLSVVVTPFGVKAARVGDRGDGQGNHGHNQADFQSLHRRLSQAPGQLDRRCGTSPVKGSCDRQDATGCVPDIHGVVAHARVGRQRKLSRAETAQWSLRPLPSKVRSANACRSALARRSRTMKSMKSR